MNKWLLMVVVAVNLLLSSDAHLIQTNKHALRGLKSTDGAEVEERGATQQLVQKLEAALPITKLRTKLQALEKAKLAQREDLVKKLVAGGADFETLYKNKVTYEEMDKALGIDKLKLPHQNADILVPEYGTLKKYSRFIGHQEKLKTTPK